jgi:tetratricopeptide (TPR) repeat protein
LALCCAVVGLVIEGHAQAPPGERGPDDPVWVEWMRPDSPDDQTALHFWELHKRGELDPEGMVDLGTMLFHRGFPHDSVRMCRQALKADSQLFEAWFRIGLVSYHLGELDDARHAYNKCLKIAPNHGWCAFYLALLEEKTGHPSRSLELYRRAFESDPKLADPATNPELLGSRLYLGALLMVKGQHTAAARRPMTPPKPDEIESVLSGDSAVPQEPTAGAAAGAPVVAPAPRAAQPPAQTGAEATGEIGAAPTLATVSPEASLAPLWPSLPEWVLALI